MIVVLYAALYIMVSKLSGIGNLFLNLYKHEYPPFEIIL